MATFTIPVAFLVESPDEASAAKALADLLGFYRLPEASLNLIESWWTPNHAEADGSDDDGPFLRWSDHRTRAEETACDCWHDEETESGGAGDLAGAGPDPAVRETA